jgi:hypothetical protein
VTTERPPAALREALEELTAPVKILPRRAKVRLAGGRRQESLVAEPRVA